MKSAANWRLLGLIVLLAFGGCFGGPIAGGDPPVDMSGDWVGTVADSPAGNGSATMSIVSDTYSALTGQGIHFTTLAPDILQGTWAFTFSASTDNVSGNLSGDVAETTANITLNVLQPATVVCTADLSGHLAGGVFSGGYSFWGCGDASGTFTLTRP